jgi:hypothetical protein
MPSAQLALEAIGIAEGGLQLVRKLEFTASLSGRKTEKSRGQTGEGHPSVGPNGAARPVDAG